MNNLSKVSSSNSPEYSISNSQQSVLNVKTLDELSKLSELLAASRFFSDAKDAAQCAVKVLAGVELGFGAFQSMSGIHIIGGKPTIGAGLMASKLKASTKYDYEAIVHSEEECVIAVFECEFAPDIRSLKKRMATGELTREQYLIAMNHLSIGVSTFTLADAKKAGTQNMAKFPRNMLFARCISNAIKWYAPDLFCVSVYVPEELGAVVDEDGNILSLPPMPVGSEPPTPPKRMISPSASVPAARVSDQSNDRDADQKAKGLMIALIGKQLVEREISRDDARVMILHRYNKEKGTELTLHQMKDFSEYIESFPVNSAIAEEGTSVE